MTISIIDEYVSASTLSYTIPATIQDGDTLILIVNRVNSFTTLLQPNSSYLSSLRSSLLGITYWERNLTTGDIGTTISHVAVAWYALWIVRGLNLTIDDTAVGSEDNFIAVTFPQTTADNTDYGTAPFTTGTGYLHLSAAFGFYIPPDPPGTPYGEVRFISESAGLPTIGDTHEYGINASQFTQSFYNVDGYSDAIDWQWTCSVSGPRTRLEITRLILGVDESGGSGGGSPDPTVAIAQNIYTIAKYERVNWKV